MVESVLLVEDDAQELFISPLILRIADENRLPLKLRSLTEQGYGGVLDAIGALNKSVRAGSQQVPELLVVGADANCRGYWERRKEIERHGGALGDGLVFAIPDPHIERWFLLDGEAFKATVGRGCQAPDMKCEKDRYKKLLTAAVIDAGRQPLLGGVEYAETLAKEIDLARASKADESFERFCGDLRARLNQLKTGGH